MNGMTQALSWRNGWRANTCSPKSKYFVLGVQFKSHPSGNLGEQFTHVKPVFEPHVHYCCSSLRLCVGSVVPYHPIPGSCLFPTVA
jgi:hypothetical protein